MSECPLPEDIIEYLKGFKEGDQREKLYNHISQCKSCLDVIRAAFDLPGIEGCMSDEKSEIWIDYAQILIQARDENKRFVKLPGLNGRRHPKWPRLFELTKEEKRRYMKQVKREALVRSVKQIKGRKKEKGELR